MPPIDTETELERAPSVPEPADVMPASAKLPWRTYVPWILWGVALIGVIAFGLWKNREHRGDYSFEYLGMRLTPWAALAAVAAGVIVLWLVPRLEAVPFRNEEPGSELEAKIKARESWAKIISALLVIVGAFAIASENLNKSIDEEHDQRYTDAVTQLTSSTESDHLTGLYGLEGLALESPRLYEARVIGVVAGFVRQHASLESTDDERFEVKSVRAAVAILGRLGTDAVSPSCVDLSGADLTSVDAPGGQFDRMCLDRSVLANARLLDARLANASLRSAVLFCADLSGADLRSADLSGAVFGLAPAPPEISSGCRQATTLRDANLEGADLRGASLRGVDLRNVDLRNADLSSAQLDGADFQDAVLDGAILTDATFTETNLRGASLKAAIFIGTQLSLAHIDGRTDFSDTAQFAPLVPLFRGDQGRSGAQPDQGPTEFDGIARIFSGEGCDGASTGTGHGIRSSAVAARYGDNLILYLGSNDSCLYALSVTEDGSELLWSHKTNGGIVSGPAMYGSKVYVTTDGELWILDGLVLGSYEQHSVESSTFSGPNVTLVDGRPVAIMGGRDGRLYAWDYERGTEFWPGGVALDTSDSNDSAGCTSPAVTDSETSATMPGFATPATPAIASSPAIASVSGNAVAFVGTLGGCLHAVNIASGTAVPGWPFDLHRDGCSLANKVTDRTILSTPAVVDGVVYFGSSDHYVYAVDAATGKRLWCATAIGAIGLSSPAVANGVVYIGDSQRYLYAFDAKSGRVVWVRDVVEELKAKGEGTDAWVSAPIVSSPVVAGDVVVVGLTTDQDDPAGFVTVWDTATGTLLDFEQTDGAVSASPVVVSGDVYVGDEAGNFWRIVGKKQET